MDTTRDPSAAPALSKSQEPQDLAGLVIVVAGATGAAGPPLVDRPSVQTSTPSATIAAYAAAKAAAEAWALAVADSFKGSGAAVVSLQIKSLVTVEMLEAKPDASFTGYTPVGELADAIHDLWHTPAADLNGQRLPG